MGQERVAIINTLDDRDSISVAELTYLTDKLRETAVKVLPKDRFGVMTTESIVDFLGSLENTIRVCKAASCLAELGRQVSADFVAQGRIGRFGPNLTIKVELYNVKTGNLIGSFAGHSKDIFGLLTIIDENAATLFKQMLSESGGSSTAPPAVVLATPQKKRKPPPTPPMATAEPYEPQSDRKQISNFSPNPSLFSLGLPQRLQLGFRAGINESSICNEPVDDAYKTYNIHSDEQCSDNSLGMQFGFVLDIAVFEWLRIQPGIMYSLRGMDGYYLLEQGVRNIDLKINQTLHYLEFPLLLSLKYYAINLNIGPSFDIPIAGDDGYMIETKFGIGFNIRMFYIGVDFMTGPNPTGVFELNVGVNL